MTTQGSVLRDSFTRGVPASALGLDTALIDVLRLDLEAANWSVDAIETLLGERALAALGREERIPALVALEGRAEPVAVLTRLFLLGQTETEADLARALPTLGVVGARALGLVEPAPDATSAVRALVDLRPHAATLPDPDALEDADRVRPFTWWVASDLTPMATGEPLRADHVLGIGGASTSLLEMTIRRRFEAALDMGCGCGIQAMYLATHCDRVVATDLSERAADFTRFNAALNRLDIDVRVGSLFEPVAAETFDLIVTNPPFVITPDALRAEEEGGLLEYRDGGMGRDDLVRTVVRGAPDRLNPGGILQMIGNWEIPFGVDPHSGWSQRLEPWFEGLPVDAWVVERDILDPARYAEMWLTDADPEGGTRADRERAYRAWLADFDEAGVAFVGMGFVAMRRILANAGGRADPEGVGTAEGVTGPDTGDGGGVETEPVLHFDLELAGCRPRGIDVERTLAALRLPGDLSDLVLVRADDVTEERHYVPGSPDPMVLILHQGAGLGRSIRVGTATSGVVGASDGELSVGQICAAVAMLTDRRTDEVRGEVEPTLRDLLRAGMVSIAARESGS